MNKILFTITLFLLINPNVSISAEKPCSQYNKLTNWKSYKECMNKGKKVTKSKSGNLLTDLNNKYKEIRKKLAPKTGEEYWKKYKEKKANEN